MVQSDDSPSETSPLLPNHSIGEHEVGSRVKEVGPDWIVVIAIGSTWLGSFLAALGEPIADT